MIVSEGACGRNFIGRRHAAMIQTRGRGTTEIACDCQEKDKNNSDRPHRELTRTRERYKNDAGDANVCVKLSQIDFLADVAVARMFDANHAISHRAVESHPRPNDLFEKIFETRLGSGRESFSQLVVRHLTARVIPRGLRSMTVHFGRIEHTSLCFASPSVTS